VCEGESSLPGAAALGAVNDEVYCDANLVPKEFVEKYETTGR
jgi:hypothetical protein